MKRLLSILAGTGLVTTASTAAVSCQSEAKPEANPKPVPKPDHRTDPNKSTIKENEATATKPSWDSEADAMFHLIPGKKGLPAETGGEPLDAGISSFTGVDASGKAITSMPNGVHYKIADSKMIDYSGPSYEAFIVHLEWFGDPAPAAQAGTYTIKLQNVPGINDATLTIKLALGN